MIDRTEQLIHIANVESSKFAAQRKDGPAFSRFVLFHLTVFLFCRAHRRGVVGCQLFRPIFSASASLGAFFSTQSRYPWGSSPCSLAVSMRLQITALAPAPSGALAKRKLVRRQGIVRLVGLSPGVGRQSLHRCSELNSKISLSNVELLHRVQAQAAQPSPWEHTAAVDVKDMIAMVDFCWIIIRIKMLYRRMPEHHVLIREIGCIRPRPAP